jgi:hypothetical protein
MNIDKYEGNRDENGKIQMHQKWCVSLLEKMPYKFAKTMPQNPHYYTLRKTWPDDELFDAVVIYIREYGQSEYWGTGRWKKKYQYFYWKGFKYWTMGSPINETILINRAEDISDYDREVRLTPSQAW